MNKNNKASGRKHGLSASFKMLEELKYFKNNLEVLANDAKIERDNFNHLVSEIVYIAQEARREKNYTLSDSLRKILNESGVEILQGSYGYNCEEVPKHLLGRPHHDTWILITDK